MKKLSFLLILLVLFTAGCSLLSTDKKKKHYYQIYYKGRSLTTEPTNTSVFVKTVEVDRLYKRSNLIYRDSAFELFYYFYHYWAVRPQDMLTDVLFYHLKQSGIVTKPLAELDRNPDYVILARLLSLDEIDSEDQWFARISMTLSLVDLHTHKTIASHTFDERQEVKNHQPVFVVRAFSAILEQQTELFLKKADKALKSISEKSEQHGDDAVESQADDIVDSPIDETVEEE